MAPAGAHRQHLTLGLDPKALSIVLLMILPCIYGLPAKTEKLISETDRYYQTEDGIRCQLCPPGYFVKKPCTIQDKIGECDPCPTGTYLMYFSAMSECISCSTCRDDQEEVSPCNSKQNTVCQCKKGTFCPPGQACEICLSCKTSCPEDQDEKAPCSSTSDLLCHSPSSPPSTSTTGNIPTVAAVFIGLGAIAIIAIVIAIIVWRKFQTNKTGCKVFEKLSLPICGGQENHKETGDPLLHHNELQFTEGMDENEIYSRSFVVIDQITPIKNFDSLMLKLGLSHNEIYRAKEESPNNVHNQHTAMLNALKEVNKFDINRLLQALRDLRLKKAAFNIAKQLLEEGLYTERPNNSA